MKGGCVITIDGPAASGKSTTARRVANRLGWLYLDTGAMYRALTVEVIRRGVSLNDGEAIGRVALDTSIELIPDQDRTRVLLDGRDVTDQIRRQEVDKAVGPVCEVDRVRKVLVRRQQEIGSAGRIVAEGRDTGTVVFPDADVKFFMVASLDARVERRIRELEAKGMEVNEGDLREAIVRRDQRDTERDHSPLRKADDAVEIDTTRMTVDEQVDLVIDTVKQRTDCLYVG